jgi:hypothetical protein
VTAPAETHATAGRRRSVAALLVLPALIFTAVVYAPVSENYFFSDDFLNLYNIGNHSLAEYLVTPNGGHILTARNAVFYVMARFAGTDPAPYYWSAVLTHLANVWLLFAVIRRLTDRARLACFAAALWGTSTFNEGTLGWYSVYGQVLVGTALLIILYQAVRAAAVRRAPSRAQRWLWYALALVAATSFGTGTGIALVLPLALSWLLPPRGGGGARWRLPLVSLVLVVPALYAALFWAYQALSGTPAIGQSALALFSEPTQIGLYLGHLTALGLTRLLLGAYPAQWATVGVWYAVLGGFAVALIAVAWRGGRDLRRRLAACTVLLLACYGTVAMARAFFLAQAPEHVLLMITRYHYVGQLILTIMLCLTLDAIAPVLPDRLHTLALVAWYAVAVFGYVRFATPIDHHLKARTQTEQVQKVIRRALDAPPRGPEVYIPNRHFAALPLPSTIFPGWAGVFTIFYPHNVVDGRRVYFVDPRPDTLAAAQRGRRTRTLLVPERPPVAPAPGP